MINGLESLKFALSGADNRIEGLRKTANTAEDRAALLAAKVRSLETDLAVEGKRSVGFPTVCTIAMLCASRSRSLLFVLDSHCGSQIICLRNDQASKLKEVQTGGCGTKRPSNHSYNFRGVPHTFLP